MSQTPSPHSAEQSPGCSQSQICHFTARKLLFHYVLHVSKWQRYIRLTWRWLSCERNKWNSGWNRLETLQCRCRAVLPYKISVVIGSLCLLYLVLLEYWPETSYNFPLSSQQGLLFFFSCGFFTQNKTGGKKENENKMYKIASLWWNQTGPWNSFQASFWDWISFKFIMSQYYVLRLYVIT